MEAEERNSLLDAQADAFLLQPAPWQEQEATEEVKLDREKE